ncbi:MAG: hypothetical protein Q8O86_05235 [Dehalococcoidia bacterium]|nr:hypothetical protein [Dehalococcoidia bacterium]
MGRSSLMFALAAAILVLVVVTQLPDSRTPPGGKVGQTGKQNGISYASWFAGEYSRPDADLALANLASTGANWVGLIVGAYQQTISSTTIYTTTDTPTDAGVLSMPLIRLTDWG